MARISGLSVLGVVLCLGACAGAADGDRSGDAARLIGLDEATLVDRFGPPERRRTDGGDGVLFYDRDRFSTLLDGGTPGVEGGRKGMDASLACYVTLRLVDDAVTEIGEAGAC